MLGLGRAGPAHTLAIAVGLVGLEREEGAGLALGDLDRDRELLELVGLDDPAPLGIAGPDDAADLLGDFRPSRSTGLSSVSRVILAFQPGTFL